jgi:anti-anti-sigma factor
MHRRETTDWPAVRIHDETAYDGASDAAHQVLRLEGRIDVRSVADVRLALHDAIDQGRHTLVLDVRDLDVADATGLGVLVGAHRRAGRAGRTLVLRDVPPRLQRLLGATRLHRILRTEPARVPQPV